MSDTAIIDRNDPDPFAGTLSSDDAGTVWTRREEWLRDDAGDIACELEELSQHPDFRVWLKDKGPIGVLARRAAEMLSR
jgi:hypothetical protein